MSKKPTPKKRLSKDRVRRRYSKYKRGQITRLQNMVNITICPACGEKKLNHHVCPHCGKYGDKIIIDKTKQVDKITKIKA